MPHVDKTPRGARSVLVLLLVAALALAYPSFPLQHAMASSNVLTVPSPYPTIQAAVNAANPGDTVLVSSGTYRENVVITKSVRLVGASPASTVVNASGIGPGFNITDASSVYISAFTIVDTGQYDNGIDIYHSTNITITGDIIKANIQTDGAFVFDSNSSTVDENIITGNLYGVEVSGGFGNLIQGNNATGNPTGDVYVTQSTGNRVLNNKLERSITGLRLWNNADGNIIARNTIANDTSEGISLLNSPRGGNLLVENQIKDNRANGYSTGVIIQNSTGNRFYHNNFTNNQADVFGVMPGDLTGNMWDNASGTQLKIDRKIMFVDSNGNGVWDYNETIVYDKDNDGIYNSSDTVIASANKMIPAANTPLKSDPKIKYADKTNDNVWEHGDPVVYDTDNNNIFEPGEPALEAVGGNYWSDYTGLDNGSHGFTGDGIGDTLIPTPCPNGGRPCSVFGAPGVDWYPLMTPWLPSHLNIAISARPLGGYPPLQISFTGSASGGVPPYAYRWQFGDGSVSSQQSMTHTYSAKGSYIATLTVMDASSATSSNEIPVTVLAPVGNLALQVLDETMKPILGANVSFLVAPPGQQRLSILTNNLVGATFTGVSSGSYLVQASNIGYQTATKNVTVVPGQTTSEHLVLIKAASPNSFPWALLGATAGAIVAIALFLVVFKKRRRPSRSRS